MLVTGGEAIRNGDFFTAAAPWSPRTVRLTPRPTRTRMRRSNTTPPSEPGVRRGRRCRLWRAERNKTAAQRAEMSRSPGSPSCARVGAGGALELINSPVTAPSGPSIPRPGPSGQADAMRRMIGSISALGAAAGTGKIVAV